ncbi:MAG: SDR family oxidoreductase [Burkholderiaceae bacterium]|nr:SDR family oxidoreductase [Burkholderiaceae bacterium]MBP6815159.1 SDR family oxidoreductase [Burkholderiaceae bacterium]MBP7658734.1 SDR family oxidoreductase [Burkholderiaceae bacterium]
MDVRGKVAVITGGASGIGRATALKFAAEGAAGVVVADMNEAGLQPVAQAVNGLAVRCDVSREADIQALVAAAEKRYGRVDIYFSNAGIGNSRGMEPDDEMWDKMWKIHGMAHVWAARAVVEPMIARGGGYFIITASAAGLLNIVESAAYAVTKHAAVAFAEWLSIAYGRRGLGVSCLCPQAVRTGMVPGDGGSAGGDGILSAEVVADEIVRVMADEKFLVLPHPEVLTYLRGKTADYDRWLGGMQKLFLKSQSTPG